MVFKKDYKKTCYETFRDEKLPTVDEVTVFNLSLHFSDIHSSVFSVKNLQFSGELENESVQRLNTVNLL